MLGCSSSVERPAWASLFRAEPYRLALFRVTVLCGCFLALLALALALSERLWKVEGGLFTYIWRFVSDCCQVALRAVWRVAFFCYWIGACRCAVSWDSWTAEGKSTPRYEDDVLTVGPYVFTAIVKVGPGYGFNGRYIRQMITGGRMGVCWLARGLGMEAV